MGLADNYLSQVRPLLEKPYLNPVERAELEDVFYQFKEEAEFIFPNLDSGKPSSAEEAKCLSLLEQMGYKGGII